MGRGLVGLLGSDGYNTGLLMFLTFVGFWIIELSK